MFDKMSVQEKASVVGTANAVSPVTCFPILRTEKPSDTKKYTV
jgi:hypothetical protein